MNINILTLPRIAIAMLLIAGTTVPFPMAAKANWSNFAWQSIGANEERELRLNQPGNQIVSQLTSPLDQADINALLDAHNHYRSEVGISNLTWSPALATSAQTWADQLIFEHDNNSDTGENLAANTSNRVNPSSLVSMVEGWGNEKNNNYIPGLPFSQAQAQASGVIGHYTQMVWRSTAEVGCGIATGVLRNGDGSLTFNRHVDQSGNPLPSTYLVCRYNPPGNFLNQVPY